MSGLGPFSTSTKTASSSSAPPRSAVEPRETFPVLAAQGEGRTDPSEQHPRQERTGPPPGQGDGAPRRSPKPTAGEGIEAGVDRPGQSPERHDEDEDACAVEGDPSGAAGIVRTLIGVRC